MVIKPSHIWIPYKNIKERITYIPLPPNDQHLRKCHLSVVSISIVRQRLDQERHTTHQRSRLETQTGVAPETHSLGDVVGFVESVLACGKCCVSLSSLWRVFLYLVTFAYIFAILCCEKIRNANFVRYALTIYMWTCTRGCAHSPETSAPRPRYVSSRQISSPVLLLNISIFKHVGAWQW